MKRRESKNLPPEKLYEILSKIYPDKVVDEIFPKLIKCEIVEKGGEEWWLNYAVMMKHTTFTMPKK